MSRAAHRIHRQVFELTVSSLETAPRIQQQVAQLQPKNLLRDMSELFDQMMDALPASDTPIRLDQVTVDLGSLAADSLQTELRGTLRREIPKAVRNALLENGLPLDELDTSASKANLRLIEQLLSKAQLPWWADPGRRQLLENAIADVMNRQPAMLMALLQRLLRSPLAARRTAQQLPPRTLGRLLDQLAPGYGSEARAIVPEITAATPLAKRRHQRIALWAAILQTAISGRQPRLSFWRDSITRFAHSNRLSIDEQISRLQPRGNAVELLRALQAEQPDSSKDRDRRSGTLNGLERLRTSILEQLPGAAGLIDALLQALRRRPAAADAFTRPILALFRSLEQGKPSNTLAATTQLLKQARRLDLLPADTLASELHRWATKAGNSDAQHLKALARDLEQDRIESAERLSDLTSTVDKDGLPIINAGLVMLWPFLKTFFDRVSLLEADTFRDQAARDNAIALLHYMTTAELNPPEHQLALEKVLCGLAPSTPWQPEQLPTAAARTECDRLLDAVIARAPNLGKLSCHGLRGSFLLRRGMLHTEADGWLLRVERADFDILLDRLPWPISWIRLPWMPVPLQVEW